MKLKSSTIKTRASFHGSPEPPAGDTLFTMSLHKAASGEKCEHGSSEARVTWSLVKVKPSESVVG